MKNNLLKAVEALKNSDFTCVLCKGEIILVSHERGVKPLLKWFDDGEKLHGFSAADRVVGKGAAFLYVLLGVSSVFAQVMSEPALAVLGEHHIETTYDLLVPAIQNRDKTGFCPIETATSFTRTPEEALPIIKQTLANLAGR